MFVSLWATCPVDCDSCRVLASQQQLQRLASSTAAAVLPACFCRCMYVAAQWLLLLQICSGCRCSVEYLHSVRTLVTQRPCIYTPMDPNFAGRYVQSSTCSSVPFNGHSSTKKTRITVHVRPSVPHQPSMQVLVCLAGSGPCLAMYSLLVMDWHSWHTSCRCNMGVHACTLLMHVCCSCMYVAHACTLLMRVCCSCVYVAHACMLLMYVCCSCMYVAHACMLLMHVCCSCVYVAHACAAVCLPSWCTPG
jgi:hypothetical protein